MTMTPERPRTIVRAAPVEASAVAGKQRPGWLTRTERRPAFWRGLPPPPEHIVVRPRVLALLDGARQGGLTLVSSPAGTGKTVAVASWINSRPLEGPVVGVSLTSLNFGAGMPWSLIASELLRAGVEVAGGVGTGDARSVRALGKAIADHPKPVTLILDCDVDLSPAGATALDELLVRAGRRARVILLTRSDPPVALQRYRRDGSLAAEIRIADLAFTPAEAHELFARRGLHLASVHLHQVVTRTRGWAAGLVLTALTLADAADVARAIDDLTGDSGPIADYLMVEVLNRQPSIVRDVLLRTSTAEILRPELVDVLVGRQGRAVLRNLARGNAFVERLEEQPESYRYQPLFRELLLAKFISEAPAEARRLQLVAAEWAARSGWLTDAIHTAVEAEAWETAARYAVEGLAIAELLTPAPTVLRNLFADLPDDATGPTGELVRAAVSAGSGDSARCAEHLAATEQRLGPTRPGPALALALASVRAAAAGLAGDDRAAVAAVADADQLLSEDPAALPAPPVELLILLRAMSARALLSDGPRPEAAASAGAVVDFGRHPGVEREYVESLGHLALLAAWQGKNRRAVRLARQALEGVPSSKASDAGSAPADVALAWVYVETDDLLRARQHAKAARAARDGGAGVGIALALGLAEARIHRAAGEHGAARAALGRCRRRPQPLSGWWQQAIAAEEAALSGPPDLARTYATLPPADPAAPVLPTEVARKVRQAQERVCRGDERAATDALVQALHLAAPERLRRPFVDAPREVRRLLLAHPGLGEHRAWLHLDSNRPMPVRGSVDRIATMEVFEPLTGKEREVLGHLAELLTTEEIAGAMFVSVNTVRTHVRNILRKLGVTRRNDAVRRARALGLLPDLRG